MQLDATLNKIISNLIRAPFLKDCQALCPQTDGATALSAEQSKAVSFLPGAEASEESLTKMYTCRTNIQYPETWDEKKTILNNIEDLVRSTTESSIDLDFLRERILEENVEEVMDYRTYCCATAKTYCCATAKPRDKKECKMDLPGRNADFGVLFPPLFLAVAPTRFLQ